MALAALLTLFPALALVVLWLALWLLQCRALLLWFVLWLALGWLLQRLVLSVDLALGFGRLALRRLLNRAAGLLLAGGI